MGDVSLFCGAGITTSMINQLTVGNLMLRCNTMLLHCSLTRKFRRYYEIFMISIYEGEYTSAQPDCWVINSISGCIMWSFIRTTICSAMNKSVRKLFVGRNLLSIFKTFLPILSESSSRFVHTFNLISTKHATRVNPYPIQLVLLFSPNLPKPCH